MTLLRVYFTPRRNCTLQPLFDFIAFSESVHTNRIFLRTAFCLLPFFFTRIGIPSTRNQWIRSPKPHLFKTSQSGLRPRLGGLGLGLSGLKRYLNSKVPRFVWMWPQFTYYLIYHCRFFHFLCTRHYTSMCMNPRYSCKRNWRHTNGNQWHIHPSLKGKIT